jgi:hypothetical protein
VGERSTSPAYRVHPWRAPGTRNQRGDSKPLVARVRIKLSPIRAVKGNKIRCHTFCPRLVYSGAASCIPVCLTSESISIDCEEMSINNRCENLVQKKYPTHQARDRVSTFGQLGLLFGCLTRNADMGICTFTLFLSSSPIVPS